MDIFKKHVLQLIVYSLGSFPKNEQSIFHYLVAIQLNWNLLGLYIIAGVFIILVQS